MQLAKCHFCGHDATLNLLTSSKVDTVQNEYIVKCTYCNAQGPNSTDENEAIEFWNNPMCDMLLKDIVSSFPNKHADDADDPEIMIFNRRIYYSYVQIWYNSETNKYKLILMYQPKGASIRDKRHMFYEEYITLTEAIIMFHDLMNKLLVDKSLDELSKGLKVYTP